MDDSASFKKMFFWTQNKTRGFLSISLLTDSEGNSVGAADRCLSVWSVCQWSNLDHEDDTILHHLIVLLIAIFKWWVLHWLGFMAKCHWKLVTSCFDQQNKQKGQNRNERSCDCDRKRKSPSLKSVPPCSAVSQSAAVMAKNLQILRAVLDAVGPLSWVHTGKQPSSSKPTFHRHILAEMTFARPLCHWLKTAKGRYLKDRAFDRSACHLGRHICVY